MEANSCLELLSGQDILTPDSEPAVVQHFLQTLHEHQVIAQSRYDDSHFRHPKKKYDLQDRLSSGQFRLKGALLT